MLQENICNIKKYGGLKSSYFTCPIYQPWAGPIPKKNGGVPPI